MAIDPGLTMALCWNYFSVEGLFLPQKSTRTCFQFKLYSHHGSTAVAISWFWTYLLMFPGHESISYPFYLYYAEREIEQFTCNIIASKKDYGSIPRCDNRYHTAACLFTCTATISYHKQTPGIHSKYHMLPSNKTIISSYRFRRSFLY